MKSKKILAFILGVIITSGGIGQTITQVYAFDGEDISKRQPSKEQILKMIYDDFKDEQMFMQLYNQNLEIFSENTSDSYYESSDNTESNDFINSDIILFSDDPWSNNSYKQNSDDIALEEKPLLNDFNQTNPSNIIFSVRGLTFKAILENEVTVVSYDGRGKTVNVPNEVSYNGKNYTVVSIGPSAFRDLKDLNNVNLSGSISQIGESAFWGCKNLISMTLPNRINKIGKEAFWGCVNLKLTKLPNELNEIGEDAFCMCRKLELTQLPNGLTEIGANAFLECKNLKLTKLPNGLNKIRHGTFAGCEKLDSIELPEGVKEIGDFAFSGCTGLKLVRLPNGLNKIGKCAFEYCANLKLTKLPNGLNKIGEEAFRDCGKLELTQLPNGLNKIGIKAFFYTGIKRITIPSSVTYLGKNSFGIKNKTDITLAKGSKLKRQDVINACK